MNATITPTNAQNAAARLENTATAELVGPPPTGSGIAEGAAPFEGNCCGAGLNAGACVVKDVHPRR